MVRRALILLCVGLLAVLMSGCGQTYEVQSVTVTPTYMLFSAAGGNQQFKVTATFSNTKTQDVTNSSSYTLSGSQANLGTVGTAGQAPLNGLNYNQSGYVQTNQAACTIVTNSSGTKVYYPYTLNISYTNNGKTVSTIAQIDVTDGC